MSSKLASRKGLVMECAVPLEVHLSTEHADVSSLAWSERGAR
jgi:hypothetical protein